MAACVVNVNSTMKNIELTVRVTGLRELRLRRWLGLLLVRAGVFVIGCRFRVDDDGEAA